MVKKIYTICLIIIFTIMLSGCAVFKESPKNRIERLYDIELPQKMDVIYSHVGETFTGEAEQYTVFKLKEKTSDFLSDEFSFNNGRDISFEDRFEDFLDSHEIPQECYPKWENEYLYHKSDNEYTLKGMYIIYFPASLELIVFTTGH